MRLGIVACVLLGLNGCVNDRVDLGRCIEDTNLVPAGDTDSIPVDTDDTDSDSNTQVSTEPDTGSDWSCFMNECTQTEECGCMPNTLCPDEGPPFIKYHCLVVDCDPHDPATCPPDIPCIDATAASAGVISWVCFKM